MGSRVQLLRFIPLHRWVEKAVIFLVFCPSVFEAVTTQLPGSLEVCSHRPLLLCCSVSPEMWLHCLTGLKQGAVWGKPSASLWVCLKHGHWLAFNVPQQRLGCTGQPSVPEGLVIVGGNFKVGKTYINLEANNGSSWGNLAKVSLASPLLTSVTPFDICPFSSSLEREVEPLTSLLWIHILYLQICLFLGWLVEGLAGYFKKQNFTLLKTSWENPGIRNHT